MSKKSLLFDLGNVLLPIDLDKTYQAFAFLSTKYNAEQIKSLTTEKALWQKYESGLQSNEDFRNFLRTELVLHCSDQEFDEAFSALLLDFPRDIYHWLKNIAQKYTIYLLSNTSDIHAQIFTKVPLGADNNSIFELFKKVFFSFELGLVKPDEKIYQCVLNDINIHPSDLIFFDDNEANVVAARKLGIDAVHIFDPIHSIQLINQKLTSLC